MANQEDQEKKTSSTYMRKPDPEEDMEAPKKRTQSNDGWVLLIISFIIGFLGFCITGTGTTTLIGFFSPLIVYTGNHLSALTLPSDDEEAEKEEWTFIKAENSNPDENRSQENPVN